MHSILSSDGVHGDEDRGAATISRLSFWIKAAGTQGVVSPPPEQCYLLDLLLALRSDLFLNLFIPGCIETVSSAPRKGVSVVQLHLPRLF